MSNEPRKTLHEIIAVDYSHAKSKAVTIAAAQMNDGHIVIIDEAHLIGPELDRILGIYGSSTKEQLEHQGRMVINLEKSLRMMRDFEVLDLHSLEPLHPEEHGLVRKNGKLIKRHHPIPKTPRSPRQSKRRR